MTESTKTLRQAGWLAAAWLAPILRLALSAADLPRPDHVVIVMEENHSFSDIIGNADAPYINSLAREGALFTDSHAIEHPSQPNYLDLFSGSNQGVTTDSCPHTLSTPNLGSELLAAGFTFAGYSEDLPAPGSTVCKVGAYRRRHAPWVNFTNLPEATNLPLTSWPADHAKLPGVSFVIPNLDNDMHNGTVKEADAWLKAHMDDYRSWAMRHNSLLIVTWDEDDNSPGDHIPTIFVGPMVKPGDYARRLDHFGVLRTLEEIFGLRALGKSEAATPITEVWVAVPPRADCNQNGVEDADDIARGASRDENHDAVPDECQTIEGILDVVEAGPGCVQLVLESNSAIRGGDLGILHGTGIVPASATIAGGLSPGTDVRLEPGDATACPSEDGGVSGLILSWRNPEGVLTPPGRSELLRICFDLPDGVYREASSPLSFAHCVQSGESRVMSVVIDPSGSPVFVPTHDGVVLVPGKPIFRRGDATEDGALDITDAVVLLSCLFKGGICPRCQDEADINDDEVLDIADGVYLLVWLFGAGPPPPPPFPDCGPDVMSAGLEPCERPSSCP